MDTIATYLDNMFRHLPRTPEVLRARGELAQMMEDSYREQRAHGSSENEAIGYVISHFGDLDELASTLGLDSAAGGVPGNAAQVGADATVPNAHVGFTASGTAAADSANLNVSDAPNPNATGTSYSSVGIASAASGAHAPAQTQTAQTQTAPTPAAMGPAAQTSTALSSANME